MVLSASVCSLISTLSSTFSDADHRAYVAEHWTAMLEESVRRIDAFRAAHPEHPIVDVQYADLVQRSGRTVGRIYGACRRRARAAPPTTRSPRTPTPTRRAKLGTHRYDLAEFGLDAAELSDRFSGYIDRYQVAAEHSTFANS